MAARASRATRPARPHRLAPAGAGHPTPPVPPAADSRAPAPAAMDARPLDRDSPMPLWAQLQQELTRRLEGGSFESAFPGELELVETYAVSRHTVREALRRLRDAGVLESSRGRVTQVRRRIEQPLGSLYSLFREVEARGMTQTNQVLALRQEQDGDAAAALGLPPDAPLIHLERLRLADDEPLAHDRVWLPADLAAPLLGADFTHCALYDELATRCGVRISGGRERITAARVPGEVRSLLRLPRGLPCLQVERAGMIDGRIVEHRVTLVRADRYAVIADWSARGFTLGADTP